MDASKLRGVIAERGMSQRQVAAAIGMSERTFYTKMKKGVFRTDEAEKMIRLLHISNPTEIFFGR